MIADTAFSRDEAFDRVPRLRRLVYYTHAHK